MSVIQKVVVNVVAPKTKKRKTKRKTRRATKSKMAQLPGQIGDGWAISSQLPPMRFFPQLSAAPPPTPASFGAPQPPINMFIGAGTPAPALNYEPTGAPKVEETPRARPAFGAFNENDIHMGAPNQETERLFPTSDRLERSFAPVPEQPPFEPPRAGYGLRPRRARSVESPRVRGGFRPHDAA